jgi:hypothetical protein
MRRQTKSFINVVPLTVAGASSRGPGTRPRVPVRRHGCQLDPRLEFDSIWWPRPSEARGIWRRSRSGGQTERCGSGAFAGKGDVCLASERSIERRFRHRRNRQSKARCVLGESIFPRAACANVAVFHWRLSMDRYTRPSPRFAKGPPAPPLPHRPRLELSCEVCRPAIQEMPGPLVSSAISGVLQMHCVFRSS